MSKIPRIGIFSLAYYPFVGGAELAVKEITDRLPDRDFVCFTHCFDPNWLAREKVGNAEVIRVGGKHSSNIDTLNAKPHTLNLVNYYGHFFQKLFYIFRAWRAAEKLHKEKPFGVIWAVMAAYGGIAALLFKLRHPEIPMLLTLQEGDSEKHILRRVGLFYPLWRLIFKKADYIQTISNYLADFAKRHGATCPIEVVPNGVAIKAFSVKRLAYSEKSKTLNAKPYTLITTSRLVHKNGIDILIRAMAVIASRQQAEKQSYKNVDRIAAPRQGGARNDTMLQILGSGPDEIKLKNLAYELGVADKVKFLGHVEPDKIPEYLARADIFVRPSRSEGLGNSFLEAIAAGLPIIGTPVGGIPDFLKDRETGLFCKVDDPQDLAEKINLLLTDDSLRNKIATSGRKLVMENYSWDMISVKMDKIFKNLNG